MRVRIAQDEVIRVLLNGGVAHGLASMYKFSNGRLRVRGNGEFPWVESNLGLHAVLQYDGWEIDI